MSASQFPPLQSKPSNKRCTNCSAQMALYTLPAHYGNTVDIDVCMACNALWFDPNESMQLSPDGTVALFQLIHEHGSTPSASGKLSEGLRCVTCGDGMKLTHDQVKGTRFSYQACRKGHGRFTTFYNFLAEKQFVRELTRAERAKLAATVHQIRCSGCGASVNIGNVDACEYCRAPVSVFDRDAAKKAIDHYLLERQKQVPATPGRFSGRSSRYSSGSSSSLDGSDLASDILFALGRAATRGLGGAGRAVPVAGASGSVLANSTLEAFPDATSALFGAGAGNAMADATTGAAATMADNLGSGISEALPSATDALFGAAASGAGEVASGFGGEIAGAFGDAASSGLGDAIGEAASGLGGSAMEAAGDAVSAVGGGVVDLVVDGIGSLLGSLFD